MKMTLVALICHSLTGISEPVCREEIVSEDDTACNQAQAVIADWKEKTIFKGDQWTVRGYKCAIGGGYIIKDRA